MNNPMNEELRNQTKEDLIDETENQESPFKLEGSSPSSPEAAAEVLREHNKSDEESDAVFGLEEREPNPEEIEVETRTDSVPSELLEEGASGESRRANSLQQDDESDSDDAVDTPLIIDLEEAKKIVETLLYVSHDPLRPRDISMVFRGVQNVDAKVVRKLIAELMNEYEDRTVQIVEVAEGYRMCTRLEFSPWVRRFLKQERRWRLSNAGLETLAIIAYKQPITKAEVEEIRRVDCGGVVNTLLERRMIRVLGRRDVIGRPIVYGTTPQFLQHFGFKNLTDLPKPEEFDLDLDLESGPSEGGIIPFESDGGSEEREASTDVSESPVPAHANGSANGHSNGHVIPAEEATEGDELISTEEEKVEE